MNIEFITLDNGVRVWIDPMPGLKSAAIGVWVGVGARFETVRENGVCHLFEHMAFKGAAGRDAKAVAEAMEALGASMNAGTGYERTGYYARVLESRTIAAFELLADLVLAPTLDGGELEREKKVVIQEIGESADTPDDHIFELHQQTVFPDQPLGRPILGTRESVGALGPDDLAAFRLAHYTPERIVVAASGAVDRGAVRAFAERRFGALAPGIVAEGAAPAQARGGVAVEARRIEQCHFAASLPAPGARDHAVYAARVAAEILGGGMASRLFQEVREKRGLAYAIDAYYDGYGDVGRFGFYAAAAPGDAAEVAAVTAGEIVRLADEGPSADELARAKALLETALMTSAESPLARCEGAAAQIFLHRAVRSLEAVLAGVEAVSPDDVRAVLGAALQGPPAAVALGPKAGLKAAGRFAAAVA